ncbi:hypothetical protein ACFX2G_021077 [Malus domestica]
MYNLSIHICYTWNLNWEELAQSILEIIFERLPLIDYISVNDVCRAWRNVIGQELSCWQRHGVPWLMTSGHRDRHLRTCGLVLAYYRIKIGRWCFLRLLEDTVGDHIKTG